LSILRPCNLLRNPNPPRSITDVPTG
jgi:hypothetical protein